MSQPKSPAGESKQQPASKYFRSLDELQQSPEFEQFLHREFPQAASEFPEGVSRRRWLQLMGASLALGGVAVSGCRWPVEKIAPFAVRPAGRIPGAPEKFATAYEIAGRVEVLAATSYDGRPIKVDGNLLYRIALDGMPKSGATRDELGNLPLAGGGSSVFAQASVLQVYDPDRSTALVQREGSTNYDKSWDDFSSWLSRAKNVAVLTQPSNSPSVHRLKEAAIAKGVKWFEIDPINRDRELAGAEIAFGKPVRTHLKLNSAKVIVSLDADLFGCHPTAERNQRQFAARRVPEDGWVNRLYAVESQFSTTGLAADHRLPLRSDQIGSFVVELEAEVKKLQSGEAKSPKFESDDEKRSPEAFFAALAHDLVSHAGECVVVVGERQGAEVHAVGHRLNKLLGAVGKTLQYTDEPLGKTDSVGQLAEFTDAAGSIDTLFVLDGNPIYDTPADSGFKAAWDKIGNKVYLGLYENETSLASQWHLPAAHPLEAWGDLMTYEGHVCAAQPLISPLYGGKSKIEVLAMIAGMKETDGKVISRNTLTSQMSDLGNDDNWRRLLHTGFTAKSQLDPITPEVKEIVDLKVGGTNWRSDASDSLEVVFTPCPKVYDGQYANLGWLQECPEPMTKLTWDNVAVIAPSTAEKLGVKQGTLIDVSFRKGTIRIPAHLVPGQAEGSIGIALGYGRTAAGAVGGDVKNGVDPVGVNAYKLRTTDAMYVGSGAKVEPKGLKYALATTQDHHSIDKAGLEATYHRVGELVREATVEEYDHAAEHGESVAEHHHHHFESINGELPWQEPSFDGHVWGMAIDQSKCVGCNACVVACQAENNVPIVGKDQVLRGREMHWLRIDRYFASDMAEPTEDKNPRAVVQPMACVQCEAAPCETVCPVAATVHSPEGLNDMAYNRCIGTRYCANNCPYKVRRFNFLDYRTHFQQQAHTGINTLVNNPDVTVRNRGVMEKCTYCVQRIQEVKIKAKNAQRAIKDGEITPACQDACSADAIVFGDLKDPNSRVSQLHKIISYNGRKHGNYRAYRVLEELYNRPRTAHLVRIRNPHPALEIESADGHHHDHDHGGDDHPSGDHPEPEKHSGLFQITLPNA